MVVSLVRFFGWRKSPSLAFAVTVALGYVSSFWQHELSLNKRNGLWCLVLGAIYALLGTIDYRYFRITISRPGRIIYLLLQAGILLGILWTSRLSGEISMCVYPLVAATVALLNPLGTTIGVIGIYAMTLGVEGYFHGMDALFRWSISMLPAFGFVVIFTRIALRERAARARSEELSAEVEKLAVLQERNRLAREIHDNIGHFLTTIHVQLEAAQTIHSADPDRALKAVAKAQGLARDALAEVRRSVSELHSEITPAPLDSRLGDLIAAADGCGATVTLEIQGTTRALSSDAQLALFRVAQEGLTNVLKHARATVAQVTLDYRDSTRIFVRVIDDGQGMSDGNVGHGLAGLRERITGLGGRVIAENHVGGGFRLEAEIPA